MASINHDLDCPTCEPDSIWALKWIAATAIYALLCYGATLGYRL